jgi:hypothetical protein
MRFRYLCEKEKKYLGGDRYEYVWNADLQLAQVLPCRLFQWQILVLTHGTTCACYNIMILQQAQVVPAAFD